MNKKAISPLISTIIMLMFAILLGAIVMSWGNNYEVKEEKECNKASIGIINFEGIPQACYTGDKVNFVIENNGKSFVDGFSVFVIGDTIFKDDIQLMLNIGDVAKGSFAYDAAKPKALRLVPKIQEEGFSTLCASSSLTVDLNQCAEVE